MKPYLRIGRFVYRRAQPSCPIRSVMYGGIPGGGGYGSYTELEIGAQRMAEATHCILGSLGKHLGKSRANWETMLRAEREHFLEEMGIIKFVIKEYRKDVYINRFDPDPPVEDFRNQEDREQYVDYARQSVESIRKASTELRKQAVKMKNHLRQQEGLPPRVAGAARSAYSLLIALSEVMEGSVYGWPEKKIFNPFWTPRLMGAVGRLNDTLNELLEEGLG